MTEPQKYALLIGINYIGTRSELNGCINDVYNVKNILTGKFDYPEDNCEMMTDHTVIKPTRMNILSAIRNRLGTLKEGDTWYIHYSGHGTYDHNYGDDFESDGNDEFICPLDEYISDDELNDLLVKQLPKGVKLRCLFDCCHSGTIMDLPLKLNAESKVTIESTNMPQKDIMMISGCRDDQTSADADIDNSYSGALTWAFCLILDELSVRDEMQNWTWRDFMVLLRFYLRRRAFDQVPQLSFTRFGDQQKKVSL
jgi:metacaspase-1